MGLQQPTAGAASKNVHSDSAPTEKMFKAETKDRMTVFKELKICKFKAERMIASRNYFEAQEQFRKAISTMISGTMRCEDKGKGMRCRAYETLTPAETADIMACCNGIAECYLHENNHSNALKWLGEIDIIHKHRLYNLAQPIHVWEDAGAVSKLPQCTYERVLALMRQANVFLHLGNTGMGLACRWTARSIILNLPRVSDALTLKIRELVPNSLINEVLRLRHPDPQLSSTLNVTHNQLQLRGSWQKLTLRKSNPLLNRMGFASFIWNGHLYVAGGQKSQDTRRYRDLWCLNLKKLDAWRQLPSFPTPQAMTGHFYGWKMAVYDSQAFLFTGQIVVDYFDLVRERWCQLRTSFPSENAGTLGTWPYCIFKTPALLDHALEIVDGQMFVFGGAGDALLGSNLLMVLDLRKREWTYLSGSPGVFPTSSMPGPRRLAISWTSDDRKYIFIMHGTADRQAAYIAKQPHAHLISESYEDVWRWNIANRTWRKERDQEGNPPSPRSEMCAVHSNNRTIVFGGYSPTLPTLDPEKPDEPFSYSYYADTFSRDADGTWRQILTRGYPTYRAQCHMHRDEQTGKIYMFGGYTNSEYVPGRRHTDADARAFGDLWHLRIDEPGGHFEGVDLQEEARTALAGPHNRCFTCASIGYWKKCGGSCKGRAFFCDKECMRDGWKEHKSLHGCSKV